MNSSTARVETGVVSLHEHLHNELCQLISVTPPTTAVTENDSVHVDAAAADGIPKKSPPQPQRRQKDDSLARRIERSRHEGRRLNKLAVVNRLMSALCDDSNNNNNNNANDVNGDCRRGDRRSNEGGRMNNHTATTHHTTPRIHGCVGTYWELYPTTNVNNNEDEDEIDDDYVDAATIMTARVNKNNNKNNDDTMAKKKSTGNNNNNNNNNMTNIIRGGGLRLPGLDFARTFRKGYTVLLWVRPMLPQTPLTTTDSKSTKWQRQRSSSSAVVPQRQILYRFATGIHDDDNSTNDNGGGKAVGVCAMIGQWRTTTASAAASDTNNENNDNCDKEEKQKMTMLTATITAYTLPNNNSEIIQNRLYPPMAVSTTKGANMNRSRSSTSSSSGSSSSGNDDEDGNNNAGGSSIHARNMEQFQQQQSSSSTTKNSSMTGAAAASLSSSSVRKRKDGRRKVEKTKKNSSGTEVDVGDDKEGEGSTPAATTVQHLPPPNGGGVYVSSDITLPANEWSLIAIQHTHPYLRRPELLISVNGEEMVRGELGFPVLDATIVPPLGGGGSGSTDHHHHHHGDVQLDEGERRRLRSMGILPECTLLDRAFDNGVMVVPPSGGKNEPTSSTIIRQSCITHVHSVALLAGPPIPNSVLALVAERGPMTDYTSSSSGCSTGLSFLLGPVSTIPQNRDAIVAPSAGYGYYGTASPDGGGGGTTIGVGSGRSMGIMGDGTGSTHELAPPRSLGIPVSVGITLGVYPNSSVFGGDGTMTTMRENSSDGDISFQNPDPTAIASVASHDSLLRQNDETWIGSAEEHTAHVCLQGLLGKVAYTFHSADTKAYGSIITSSTPPSSPPRPRRTSSGWQLEPRRRIVCLPSAAPSRIGGADAVPKVGIVRPTVPSPPISSAGMEITGNACYQNTTWNYIQRERQRDTTTIRICPPVTASKSDEYNLNDNPPISFPRAIQAANAMNISLLPFRLALPHAGNEQVNDMQRKLHNDSFVHLNDLLCNDAELAGDLIWLIAECIRCGGSAMRDDALQNGVIHILATLVRKVLIRGFRLGLVVAKSETNSIPSRSSRKLSNENIDYDMNHESSCPPIIPKTIAHAIVGLIDVCCGPCQYHSVTNCNPCRGLLRIRRASDLALSAVFGLAMDIDLLGNDSAGARPILKAIASRYCHVDMTTIPQNQVDSFFGEDYGSLLRKQINLQYFLDCLRIRFDHSLFPPKGVLQKGVVISSTKSVRSVESVASSFSDILYTMLLSTLKSTAGVSVSRGERDIGALVGTLTECPLGSVCAHVITTTIARLLVNCGVMSAVCLGLSPSPTRKKKGRRRLPEDIALESRLARNLLLCHYHDIVAPLLLSRSSPRFSYQSKGSELYYVNENASLELSPSIDFDSKFDCDDMHPLDWTYHWRLSLLTFAWLSSLTGVEESKSICTSTGHLILLAGKAGSLDNAMLGYQVDKKSIKDVMEGLSQFLVYNSINEKYNSVDSLRRISAFMPLVPGMVQSLLSPSMMKHDSDSDQLQGTFVVTDATAHAVGMLKQLLTTLSLAIQSLYGSKAGKKPESTGDDQLQRRKKVFILAANEYVPILLQIAMLLNVNQKQFYDNRQSKDQSNSTNTDDTHEPSIIPDSTDVDWVDISFATEDIISENSAKLSTPSSTKVLDEKFLERRDSLNDIQHDLSSAHEMALYAASRLVAQTMMYGGGEASTGIWRSVITSLSDKIYTLSGASGPANEMNHDPANSEPPTKSEKTVQSPILCHLAALVLSKFGRHHNPRLETYRSPWNVETCSAVARLMDLVEEKELLSFPFRNNSANDADSSRKYSIDQVRLIKSLLEVMGSGRECGGWAQINSSPRLTSDDHQIDDKKVETVESTVEDSLPHRNYELYHNTSGVGKQLSTANVKKPGELSSSKLLLPILQSCVRILVPTTGTIRSDAVIISSGTRTSPSTSILLESICDELDQSLVSAIQGLIFPVSRDVFMNAVATFRRSIAHHLTVGDTKAVAICSSSVMVIVRSMSDRYIEESKRKEKAYFAAYEKDGGTPTESEQVEEENESLHADKSKLNKEGIHAQVVERIITGKNVVPEMNGDDFVAFPGDANADDPTMHNMPMGWSHYKGLGAALNQSCREEAIFQSSAKKAELVLCSSEKAKLVLTIIGRYIDHWDKIQLQDADDLVDLFDESMNLGSTSKLCTGKSDALPLVNTLSGNVTSSDAMARFIEVQSILRHQQQHLAFDYFLRRRFGRSAFVERLSWNTWMDCIDAEVGNCLWERAVNDGGRDFSSKIATVPVFPLFPRFIPSYLDHSPELLRQSSSIIDIKALSQAVKIVDITKKEITEEMLVQFDNLDETQANADMIQDFEEKEADLYFADTDRQESNTPSAKGENIDEFVPNGNTDKNDDSVPTDIKFTKSRDNLQGGFHFAASSFSFPPDSSSLHSLGEGRRLGGGSMEEYYSSCLHVKPDCSLKCTVILTESHLIIEYEDGEGIDDDTNESYRPKKQIDLSVNEIQKQDEEKHMKAAMRLKATRWNISEASHIYLRRYRLRDSALELFFIPSAGVTTGGTAFFAGSRSLFLDFGSGTWGNTRRDDAANAIMKRAPMQTVKQYPDKSGQFLHEELKKLMQAWCHGAISNFDYLLSLNILAGRSYNDICQYPVFPWVLSNYTSEEVPDLSDITNFRDLSKPMGALNEERLAELLDRFHTFDDPCLPPFMYGSHYSTSAGVVIHFLIRLHPYSSLHRELQSGHFDVADRLFSSVERTWNMCTGRSAAEVKELTPEFYSNPSFLRNSNDFKLGTSQDGEVLGDVILPPWAKGSPEKFVEIMRLALESDVCSKMLPAWIDIIFGRKQQGKAAIEANNVYFYLTYYGSVDVASIEDEGLRKATELQIAHFGQCPMQLFYRNHAKKKSRRTLSHRHQTLSDLYDMKMKPLSKLQSFDQVQTRNLENEETGMPKTDLPFTDAPLSYWVHLGAPPPGPHAPLVSIRLSSTDRCLAIDSKGVFHFFRWAWKPEFDNDDMSDYGAIQDDDDNNEDDDVNNRREKNDIFSDKGCFVAQRELFSFRTIPRLPYTTSGGGGEEHRNATVAISKTMFANRSLILVVSDGDGKGALAIQLVDPIKGQIQGEVIVPSIHADCITAIDMDPMGTASGQGGVGGELVFVGSADGCTTLWRFISSHYWPLRPRMRMGGHGGSSIFGVAISCSLGICASVSSKLCCLFDIGNGAMIRNFNPPQYDRRQDDDGEEYTTEKTFANTQAFCLSTLGFVIAVCTTKFIHRESSKKKEELSLELFTVEGRHIGTHPLSSLMGMPKKILPTVDGRAVFVCGRGGVTVHLVSSLQPLAIVDRWTLSEDNSNSEQQAVYDIDFGPTLARPVVAAVGCTAGALRLHALRGISSWSHENQRHTVSSAVGSVLALPAQTVKNALGGVSSFGSSFFGSAKEISKEAFSVVKERDGGFFFRKKKG